MGVNYEMLGNRIRRRRLTLRLRQVDVARAINLSPTFYGNIERGNRIPSVDTLVSIANELDVGLDYLLCDSLAIDGSKNLSPEARCAIRTFLSDQIAELDYDS